MTVHVVTGLETTIKLPCIKDKDTDIATQIKQFEDILRCNGMDRKGRARPYMPMDKLTMFQQCFELNSTRALPSQH